MSRLKEVMAPLIQPIYAQAAPNEPIELGSVDVQFEHEGITYAEPAAVVMRFLPKHRLSFVITAEGKSPLFGMSLLSDKDWNGQLTLVERGVTIECVLSAVSSDGIVLIPRTSCVEVTPPASAITTVTFHLFNFAEFRGPEDYSLVSGNTSQVSSKHCGCVVLEAGGWRITLAATVDTRDLAKALKEQGGHVITHVGTVARDDGSTFNTAEAEDVLTCLHYFLSFAIGRWAGLALPVGFDADGDRVYEQWGMRRTSPDLWDGAMAWFDPLCGGLLKEVFPGFFALWNSELWRRPLTEALYWYLGACRGGAGIGVDTGLILAQTALELLAWTYCVQDRKMVSQAAFKPRGLSAADKLRLLACSVGVPTHIPAELPYLLAKPGHKWIDGMEAVTAIRNSLVHPDAGSQMAPDWDYDAWRLSLWYIELTLLRLCGHHGRYANRLRTRWAGQVEVVPWARSQPSNVDTDKSSEVS